VFAAGCVDTTPQWQLDHDRIIAVRATPPHAVAGGQIALDLLITTKDGDGPQVVPPIQAAVAPNGPPGFDGAVVPDGAGGWVVDVPDEDTLAAARTAMGLDADAPVPLLVGLGVLAGETQLAAVKTVYCGDAQDNPDLGDVTVDGAPATDDMVVPLDEEVPLTIDAPDTDKIDWLSSVGDLTDIQDTTGHLTATEAMDGYLAVVRRDPTGGVAWGYWTISSQ
jgi:hypothetical protein